MCQTEVNGVIAARDSEFGTLGLWDPFELMDIPVVVNTGVHVPPFPGSPGEDVSTTGSFDEQLYGGSSELVGVNPMPGYFITATVGNAWEFFGGIPGIQFTSTGPTTAEFTSRLSFTQTVTAFKSAGFVQNPEDYVDFFHPGQLDLRDAAPFCSAHVAINKNSGLVPGSPTTGDAHLDFVNPWAPSPFPSVMGPSGPWLPTAHLFSDVLGLYPGSVACRP